MTNFALTVVLICLLCGTTIGQDTKILQATLSNIARFAYTESLPNADRIELYTLSKVTAEDESEMGPRNHLNDSCSLLEAMMKKTSHLSTLVLIHT